MACLLTRFLLVVLSRVSRSLESEVHLSIEHFLLFLVAVH